MAENFEKKYYELMKKAKEALGLKLTFEKSAADCKYGYCMAYTGIVARVENKNGVAVCIVAAGAKIVTFRNPDGTEIVARSHREFDEFILPHISGDDEFRAMENDGRLTCALTNWFEAIGECKGSNETYDLGTVLDDDLFEAVDQVLDYFQEFEAHILEERRAYDFENEDSYYDGDDGDD